MLLPCLVGRGNNRHGASSRGGLHGRHTDRLVLSAVHTREHEVIAKAIESHDGAINTPLVRQLASIGEGVPRGISTYIVLSQSGEISQTFGHLLPVRTWTR